MTKRTTLDLGLSDGGESLNLRTKKLLVPPPKKGTMADQHMLVCLTCHAYGSNPVELASWSGREDYCDWHDRVLWMTEEEYCAWADAQSMVHDDGGA